MDLTRSALISLVFALSLGACQRADESHSTAAAITPMQSNAAPILQDLQNALGTYRKIIVLLDDEKALSTNDKALANRIGQTLFHENLARREQIETALNTLVKSSASDRFSALDGLLSYIESGEGLFDADRLAFREVLATLEKTVAADGTLPAIKLHKRVTEDLDALAEIERNYEKELGRIFSRFETRSIELKREKWQDYVAKLRQILPREQILKDYGVILPYPVAKAAKPSAEGEEVFGHSLPPKTVVLTFDDGPHGTYTDEIAAILKQYNAPAIFFSVGRNLGSVDAEGKPKLGPRAATSRKLEDAGFVLANHSFTHAQLAKESGDPLLAEIANTDTLLKAISVKRSPLFRFPYGAHNEEGLATLKKLQLKSIMWNIDSLDWADPVPSSIADRVLRTVDKEGRGIILFHDIHERTVKALPLVLERLAAEGYRFAGWNGAGFSVANAAATPIKEASPVNASYGDAWAIVIGIDDYARWPKLQYAVRDAQTIKQALIDKLGFAPERTFVLKNAEATRNGILALFHDKLAHGAIQKGDRLFVFFAGHGATRKLSSGRDLGYLIPADSDPANIAADAISMTEIQDIAESLSARHVLFVMDACYSGLGLTRGGSQNFLKDNARRIGRQMLTAGGADQLVADGGPNGHSVFTWTLLQALAGKGDLNGDGFITGTELAAYVAPAVASISRQTPAFGSLPGSEGGEFVFELRGESEFLNAQTNQLASDAIALNSKLDEARAKQSATPIVVKDLQGEARTLEVPKPALAATARQMAQRANDRGLQLYREKHYAEAEAQFTEALKYRPDFALAANNLGFVYYKQEKYREAARWFENTIRIDPSRAIAYLNLGDAAARAGDTEKAKSAYRTYLELAPNGSSEALAKQQLERL